jgi:Nitroreductase
MELTKAIAKRKSARAYKPDALSEETLNAILAAGCAAPVGMAQYGTLHFTVIENKEILEQISNMVKQMMKREGDPLYAAPTLVVISSKEPMAPGIDYTNAACIAENMMLAATDANVGSVLIWSPAMAVEADSSLKQAIAIPEGYKALFSVALGYPANDDDKEKELKVTIGMNIVK